MGTYPPDYCPYCGTEVRAVEAPSVYHCESCADYVFHSPTPNCRVVVVDSDSALLVEILDEYRLDDPPYETGSEWMTPGGHPEIGEQPQVAAARELREETNLAVDPDALVLFEAVARQVVEGAHALVLLYAVERGATTGTLAADSDAGDARFWTPAELANADASFRDLHTEPDDCRELGWWVSRAQAAVGTTR